MEIAISRTAYVDEARCILLGFSLMSDSNFQEHQDDVEKSKIVFGIGQTTSIIGDEDGNEASSLGFGAKVAEVGQRVSQ